MILFPLLSLAAACAANAQRQPSRSPHGTLNIPCENCHTSASWSPIRAIPEFNHDATRYPLRGMHEKVTCTGCHLKPVFTNVGKNCSDCHGDIHRAQFGANCAQCHTPLGWQVSVQSIQNHFNRFPLLGAHAVVECDQCHKNAAVGNYLGLSTACDSCHMKDWQNTTSPAHASAPASFPPNECQACHQSFDTWLGSTAVNHAAPPINFPLTLGHANVPCEQCHVGGNFHLQIAASDCGNSQCHLTTWQQTNNPVHSSAGAQFAVTNCQNCHTTASWLTANFDHSQTGFPLNLGHANVACASCHLNNNYTLTIGARDCGNSQCHLTLWQQTTTPVHSTSGAAFGAANCGNCHTPAGWTTAAFDHSVTGFTLIGTHMSPTPTPCASCHYGPNPYSLSSTDCYGCHSAVFQSTANIGGTVPNHVAAGFPTASAQCASCHPITTWSAGVFNHSAFGFALTNGHANVACALCHIGGNYSLQIAATDCGNSQCHLTIWQQTNAPPHAATPNSFPIANCSICHTTVSWTAAFDHSTTGFALTGMHVSPVPTPCASCHYGASPYSLTSAACYGCHVNAWQSTTTLGGTVPNHVALGFPQTCESCHTTSSWLGATFDHSTTGFPLTGAHVTTACNLCHTSSAVPSTLCYNCHLDKWQSTVTLGGSVPNHIALGYPTTCQSCHTTTSWLGAVFDHSTTGFPLTGAHITVACNLCHTSSAVPPTDCYSCHTAQWQSTATLGGNVPNHLATDASAIGIIPSACATCHTTTNWLGATFTHTWWNTNHGNAGGICATCHTSSTTYTVFVCSNGTCHPKSSVDNIHQGNSSYVYSTGVTCYACHHP